ncbi:hypothetical protein CROQUDRAFT_460219 [Cronartium quercuum f. sp. fusiforme G11]|uniref:Uncharacterized protein n=1 Tax=Cronartium quercuum f. sp. fusiforme G11 TaxID=708437 RepID=A0A9P6TDB6_9BASI|nr:hypothetical protein CROQUDRAFT_460219 [Cronartium quercuum f. sp. fusiforme G11]
MSSYPRESTLETPQHRSTILFKALNLWLYEYGFTPPPSSLKDCNIIILSSSLHCVSKKMFIIMIS